MKKILNKDFARIEALHIALNGHVATYNVLGQELQQEVNKLIERYLEEHREEIEKTVNAINNTQNKLSPLIINQVDKMDKYFEGRSNEWHSSSAAELFMDWRDDWGGFGSEMDTELGFYDYDELVVNDIIDNELPKQNLS